LIDDNLGTATNVREALIDHEISDFHINNVNNENAGEDEGDSSPIESEFVGNLKNVHNTLIWMNLVNWQIFIGLKSRTLYFILRDSSRYI
jgi:hypothetical protein